MTPAMTASERTDTERLYSKEWLDRMLATADDALAAAGGTSFGELQRAINSVVPAVGAHRKCIVCACHKPWGIFDSATGAAVCIGCRDRARTP